MPVPEGGVGRVLIYKTYKDPRSVGWFILDLPIRSPYFRYVQTAKGLRDKRLATH